MQVFTVGYEDASVDSFIAALTRAGVKRVVDVRELPLSRRKGFSKTKLREVLAEHEIEYLHIRAAGNPYRDQKKNIALCLSNYRKHLDVTPEAVDEVERAIGPEPAALLCFERDHHLCHRSVLARFLVARNPDLVLRHL